jgi:RNA-splicing ligase RtcB
LKTFIILAVTMLSACGWFHSKARAPDPSQIIVTGAPKGSIVFVDDVQQGQAAESNVRPQLIDLGTGEHKVEIRFGDSVVYRENIYINSGEKRVVTVLSGANRD